jgi:hypothetical protein
MITQWNKEDPRICLYHNKGTEIIINAKGSFLIGNVYTKDDYDVRFDGNYSNQKPMSLKECDDWPEDWYWVCSPSFEMECKYSDVCLTMHEEFIIDFCILEKVDRKSCCVLTDFEKHKILNILGGDAFKIAKAIIDYSKEGIESLNKYEAKIQKYVKEKLDI